LKSNLGSIGPVVAGAATAVCGLILKYVPIATVLASAPI
jgi:hypothetical protein